MYDFQTLKDAITFNAQEILPTKPEQLDEEIKTLVNAANESGEVIKHYIGFEISGLIHFPGSVYQMMSVARLQQAGVHCILWMADYHTKVNNKFGGDMKVIRKIAHEYFEPIFKLALDVAGGDSSKIEFRYAETEYFRPDEDGEYFWDYEFEAEKSFTISRALRSLSAAGKEAGLDTEYMTSRYPGMQAADVFWHQTPLVLGGLDQRKLYVLARDMARKMQDKYALKIGEQKISPIIVFNNLLLGLGGAEKEAGENLNKSEVNKMSKSKPDSAIWVHDSYDEMVRKLKKAYCPMPQEGQSREEIVAEQEWNPMLDWCRKMVFPAGKVLKIERPEKYGGNLTFSTLEELEKSYYAGDLHAMDLKSGVAKTLSDWFAPMIQWAEENGEIVEYVRTAKR